jgi:hypothetical protein
MHTLIVTNKRTYVYLYKYAFFNQYEDMQTERKKQLRN